MAANPIKVRAYGKIHNFPAGTTPEAIEAALAEHEPILNPEYKAPEPEALDYAKGFASGANKLVSGVGFLAEAAGANETGKAIREFGDRGAKYWNDKMSKGGKAAAQSQVFVDDDNEDSITGIKLSDDWGKALLMGASQSLPSMFAAAIPGVAATRGIQALAKLGLAGGAGATIPLLAGTAAPVGVASNIIARAPSAIGFGTAEGVTAGAMNAAEFKTSIESMTDQELNKSPVYRALKEEHDPETARSMLAEQASLDLFGKTALSTGVIGALTGGGALAQSYQKVTAGAKSGLLGTVIKGAGAEALQEAPQSGGEKFIENLTTQNFLDPTQSLSEGVATAAASGAAVGGLMGGVIGGGGAVNVTPDRRAQVLNEKRKIAEMKASAINAQQQEQSMSDIGAATDIDQAIAATVSAVSKPAANANDILRAEDPTLADIEKLTGLKPTQAIDSAIDEINNPIIDQPLEAENGNNQTAQQKATTKTPVLKQSDTVTEGSTPTSGAIKEPTGAPETSGISGRSAGERSVEGAVNKTAKPSVKTQTLTKDAPVLNAEMFRASDKTGTSHTEYLKSHPNRKQAAAIDTQNVESNLIKGLQKTGKFTATDSKTYAKPFTEFYKVNAERQGILPSELYERMPLKFNGTKSQRLSQDAKVTPASRNKVNFDLKDATPEDFTPDNVGSLLNKKNWAVLTAVNPAGKAQDDAANSKANEKLQKELADKGLAFEVVKGRYPGDKAEMESYLVYGLDQKAANELGNKYGQDSVLTREGLVHQSGKVTPVKAVGKGTPDGYTKVPRTGARFAFDMDWDREDSVGEGALSVVARHYSKAPRKALEGSRFGEGYPGKERDRLAEADDPRLKSRVDFYVDTGEGVTPETGLGEHIHEKLLHNIYDASTNPKRFKFPSDWLGANTFEKQVLDAGYDGYFTKQGKQGRVVVLGAAAKSIPIEDSNDQGREGELLSQSEGTDTSTRESDGSLQGLPRQVGQFNAALHKKAEKVAKDYMNSAGLEYNPPNTYANVNVERAERIATSFDTMKHDPQNPEVKAAYAALVKETTAQYKAVVDSGLKVEFIDFAKTGDPYKGNPRAMTEDVRKNNHMWVFGTRDGFGSSDFDPADNPLLAETEFEISGQKALANDLFRVVHDYFGHVKEGVGFRAAGEENAWRAHMAMFSPEAGRALTTETRGQNSWVNYGPFAEFNKTASGADTKYADQKIGLLPEWVSTEGRSDEEYNQSVKLSTAKDNLKKYGLKPDGRYSTRQVAAALEARQRAKFGSITAGDYSKESLDKIASWMAEEVAFEMQNPEDSGAGWYSERFQRALDAMGEKYPELKTDKNARNTFTALLAITSDGQKVGANLKLADGIYGRYKETGKFTIRGDAAQRNSFQGNLDALQDIVDKMGVEKAHEFLLDEKSLSELKKLAAEHGQTLNSPYQADFKLPMAALAFGPKLGAFYANLMGSHGYLTMDRWWSRTFNRYRGSLLQSPTKASLPTFRELIGQDNLSDDETVAATVALRNALEARGFKTRLAELVGSSEPATDKAKVNWMETAKAKAGARFPELLKEHNIERAANTIYKKAFVNLEDAPFGAKDRTFMTDATKAAQKKLAKKGMHPSIADIQAILWYYEKKLYGKMGAKQSGVISYEDAARRLISGKADGPDFEGGTGATATGLGNEEVSIGDEDFGESYAQSNFYSALEKEIRGLSKIANKNGEVSVEQAKAWINSRQKEGKFKQAEVEAVGLNDWLDTLEGKVPVTDVEEFVQENGVQVEEVVLEGEGEFNIDEDAINDEAYENFIQNYYGPPDWVFKEAIEEVAGEMMDSYDDPRWSSLLNLRSEEEVNDWFEEEGVENTLDMTRALKDLDVQEVLGEDEYYRISDEEQQLDWENNQDYLLNAARERAMNESGGASGGTEFSDYVLRGGGAEYKELLLTLPNSKAKFNAPHFDKAQDDGAENIFAHTRINERYINGENGTERVLFVEEIQSDWAQKGRDEGFNKKLTPEERKELADLNAERQTILSAPFSERTQEQDIRSNEITDRMYELKEDKGIPTAPFVTDTKAWTGLVAKRLLRYAAENGFDRIAWTAGAQQAERYRLSKFIDSVQATRREDGRYKVTAFDESGTKRVIHENYEANELTGVVGKELADKIINQPEGEQRYTGLDLDVGGSGMKEFYDRIVPSVFNDVSKKLGGDKVETISMGGQSGKVVTGLEGRIVITYPNGSYLKNRNTGVMTESQDRADRFDSKEEANKYLDKFEAQNLHEVGRQMSLKITPALKDKVMQGLPLFQRDRAGYNPNNFTISLMEGSDMTSVIHEGGHFYLEALADMASRPDAPEQIVKDFDTTLDWFGVTKDDWKTMSLEQKRPHHEQWAQSYERYAMEGVAPTEEMQSVFDRFKQWMIEEYRSLKEFLKDNPLASRLNNDVRQVFDRLLASEGDIAATAAARGTLKQSGKQTPPKTQAGSGATSTTPPAAAPKKPFDPNTDIPETKFRKSQRLSQDSFNRFNVIKDWLAEHGTILSEKADVFQAEERYNSLVANQLEDFREQERIPLTERIAKAGFTIPDVADFLEAQHAQEANKAIRELRGEPDATAYGITDEEAKAYLDKADPKLAKLANEVRAIAEKSKQMRLEAGLLSQEEVDAWESAYKFYIPVKGDADAKGGTGKGLKVNFKAKRRLGHGKRDEAVVENIFLDHEKAIMQIEKNRVAKHLVMMAAEMNRPEIVSVGQPVKRNVLRNKVAYEVQVNGVTRSVFTTKQAADMFKQLLPTIDPTVQTGSVSIDKTTDQRVIGMASPMLAENEINAYIDGHAVRVQINDDLLARAYGKLGVTGFSALVSAGRAFNGYLSKVYTGYNPEFIITNMIRDFTSGLINLTGEEGAKISSKAAKNYVKSFSSLMRYAISNGKKSDKWIDMYRANGGNTGAAYLSDLERLGDEVKTDYASYLGVMSNLKSGDIANASRAAGRKVFNVTLKWIYNLNQAGENAMRLAAFRAMIESGKTPNQAAKASKNITVNFNRKGELGAEANAAYLFFNASVQGTAALAHAHFKGKHKYQAWGLSSMVGALGYMAALALIGDDEDDYDKINDYTKSRNLLIKAGEGYAQIPVPYGYGFFWNTGRAIAEAQHKGELGVLPWHMAASAIEELTPFSDTVVGSQDGFHFDQVLLGLLPTVIKIPAQPALNKQLFSGGELFPERDSQQFQPDREKLWRSTQGTMYDKMAGWLTEAGVGDVTPETLKHYTRTFTGGTGALVDASISAAMLKKEGAELEPSEIPFVRKAYLKLTIKENRAAYYKAREEAKKTAEAFSRAQTRNDVTTIDKLIKDEGEMLGLDAYANSLSEAIGAVRDMQDAIRVDESMNAAEKRVQIKELEITEQKFYDQYLDVFKIEKMNMKSRKD